MKQFLKLQIDMKCRCTYQEKTKKNEFNLNLKSTSLKVNQMIKANLARSRINFKDELKNN